MRIGSSQRERERERERERARARARAREKELARCRSPHLFKHAVACFAKIIMSSRVVVPGLPADASEPCAHTAHACDGRGARTWVEVWTLLAEQKEVVEVVQTISASRSQSSDVSNVSTPQAVEDVVEETQTTPQERILWMQLCQRSSGMLHGKNCRRACTIVRRSRLWTSQRHRSSRRSRKGISRCFRNK